MHPNNVDVLVQGIVKALTEYRHQLLENRVRIFVRRGGPNYQEGLKVMREVGERNDFSVGFIHVT